MAFDKIKRSIAVHSDQEPTIYSALCMVECLFADVEDWTDKELAYCEPGDADKMAVKLLWLCDQVLDVQKRNGGASRWEKDLEAAMAEIATAKAALMDACSVAEQVQRKREEYSLMQLEHEKLLANQAECRRLEAERQALEQKVQVLRTVDVESARLRVEGARKQVQELEMQKQELLSRVDGIRAQELEPLNAQVLLLQQGVADVDRVAAGLMEQITSLQAQKLALEESVEALNRQTDDLTEQRDSAAERIRELSDGNRSLEEEIRQLRLDQTLQEQMQAERNAEKQGLQQQIDCFKKDKLVPLEQETARLQMEIEQEERLLTKSREQVCALREKKTQIIEETNTLNSELGELNETLPELEKRLGNITVIHKDARKRQLELTETYEELEKQWSSLYTENAATEREKLPRAQEKIDAEMRKLEALRNQHHAKDEELKSLQGRVSEMEELLVCSTREYEALTEQFNEADSTSKQLLKDIEELKLQTDGAKVESYRRQLEEKRNELQSLRTEESNLNAQIEANSRQCAELTTELEILRGRKAELDKSTAETQRLRQEMERYATREFTEELNSAKVRLEILSKAHRALLRDMSLMREALKSSPFAVPVNADMTMLLGNLGKAVNAVSDSLLSCADSLKLEVK